MVTEVFVGIIAVAFAILTIFLILAINTLRQTLKHTDQAIVDMRKKIDQASGPSIELLNHLNHLAKDISKKSEALNVFFAPLQHGQAKNAIVVDSLKLLSDGVHLFNEVKNVVESHSKRRKKRK